MINKRISKITMVTTLLMAGVVNAQEFYTCVPKKSWWKDTIKESVPSANDIANAMPKSNNQPVSWSTILNLRPSSYQDEFKQTLYPGKYRVSAAAAGGERVIKEFTLTVPTEFKACVGARGGEPSGKKGGYGGGGMGYDGAYGGYGKGKFGESGFSSAIPSNVSFGEGGLGCYRGGYGGTYTASDNDGVGLAGGGGGSYFAMDGVIELVLKGGDGATTSDGYIKIEQLK